MAAHRLVLLGASNVARGIDIALETARLFLGRPLEVLGAFGHGRSYGQRGGLLWHQQPGIAECGLWRALSERPPAPTAALVTDVGNDLLWDVPVPEIVEWVRACVERLLTANARIVLTPLPLFSIRGLSKAKFVAFRTLTFPGCRLTLDVVIERARALDEQLRSLALRHELCLAEPRPEWYGFDPIHILRWRYPEAWHAMMRCWRPGISPEPPLAQGSLRLWLYVKALAPERHWLFGRYRERQQPVGKLPDGSSLSFF